MDPMQLNPLALAYLGDAVYELEVRRYLLDQGMVRVKQLHSAAVGMVKATTQAKAMHRLQGLLDEEESGIVRRGRNAKSGSIPKHTDVIDYRYATAFECLIGYWYLKGDRNKIEGAFQHALQVVMETADKSGLDRVE